MNLPAEPMNQIMEDVIRRMIAPTVTDQADMLEEQADRMRQAIEMDERRELELRQQARALRARTSPDA